MRTRNPNTSGWIKPTSVCPPHLGLGVDVAQVRSNAGSVDDIVERELGNVCVPLDEQRKGLSDASGSSENGDFDLHATSTGEYATPSASSSTSCERLKTAGSRRPRRGNRAGQRPNPSLHASPRLESCRHPAPHPGRHPRRTILED